MPPLVWLCVPAFVKRSQEPLRPPGFRSYEVNPDTPMGAAALSGFSNAYALFVHVLPAAGGDLRAPSVAKAALATKLPQGSLANGGGLDLAPPGAVDAGANRRSAGVIEEWVAPGKKATVWPPDRPSSTSGREVTRRGPHWPKSTRPTTLRCCCDSQCGR